MTQTAPILGIDIGGSFIKAALVHPASGEVLGAFEKVATPEGASPQDVLEALTELSSKFEGFSCIGVTFPGIVIGNQTLSAANVDKRWIGLDADAFLTEGLGKEVHLLNDADAAALAEARFGAARGAKNVTMVLTFGTGIGSGLLMNGVLVPNTELGHLWLRGKNGEAVHAEAYAAARLVGDEISEEEWVPRVQEYLDFIEALFSPSLIVLGGGISADADRWLHKLQSKRAKLLPAELANSAGVIGAAMFAAENN